MSEGELLELNARKFLERALRLGHAVLFTGAGFSHHARNRVGSPIPLGSELKQLLWPLAFPGDPFDPESSLGDIFDLAVQQRRNETGRLLRDVLTVDTETVPDFYQHCFSIPWYRIYTINVDTLISACQSAFSLPSEIRLLSALRDLIPPPESLSAVHLNGTLDDYPAITFTPAQYGKRAAAPDHAYTTFIRDLMTHPVIFVGTELNEPSMWQHMAMRGDPPSGRDLRPKSFLVTPSLSRARAAMLERFKIWHIPLTTEEFIEEFLDSTARETLARPFAKPARGEPFIDVAAVAAEPVETPADFLLGREPSWGDITQGFAIERAFEQEIADGTLAGDNRFIFISGTAGSGKSSTARRLALTLQADGQKVLWLREDASETLVQIRSAALAADADFVFIDGAERFGHRGVELLRAIGDSKDGPRVVMTYSSTAFDELGIRTEMETTPHDEHVIPLLTDVDITQLVATLQRANRLGALAGLTPDEQFNAIKQRAGRQLLVAMLEATSNQRFEDKIANECQALSGDLVLAYIVTALATLHRYKLRVEDLLAALSEVTAAGLDIVDRLVRQHLVLRSSYGHLATRHSVIARQVIAFYRANGQLGDAIARLAFVLASKVYPGMPLTPERRLLTTLTSHEFVGQVIDSRVQIRQMYEELEPLLRLDPHYWLQRGSYELERGDLGLAENFLAQAKGLSENDYMVQTECAYLLLERACRTPKDPMAPSWFTEGLDVLLAVCDRIGLRTPNTYVVLAEKAVTWAGIGPLTRDQRKNLLETVRAALSSGSEYHTANRQFTTAREKVERAYLNLAVS